MTHLEMSLAFVLFCKKYDGYDAEDIPNIRHRCGVNRIILDKMSIIGNSCLIKNETEFHYSNTIFFRSEDGSLRLNRTGYIETSKEHLNIYYTFKDFTNDFNLSIEDNV